jgi:hypothetical protein
MDYNIEIVFGYFVFLISLILVCSEIQKFNLIYFHQILMIITLL